MGLDLGKGAREERNRRVVADAMGPKLGKGTLVELRHDVEAVCAPEGVIADHRPVVRRPTVRVCQGSLGLRCSEGRVARRVMVVDGDGMMLDDAFDCLGLGLFERLVDWLES